MATEKNLRDELLRQNGVDPRQGEELRDRILARDEAGVARMKRLTVCAWIVVGASLIMAGIVRLSFPDVLESKPQLVPLFITVWNGLLLIAIFFTLSLYVRSRTLTMHQIQSSLALIEEHLRRMSQKD